MAGTETFEDLGRDHSAQPAPRTFAEVLAPLTPQQFIQEYLGKNYCYLPGQPGKFAGLLPWSDLNRILRTSQLDVPRLRLARDGKPIPPESFLSYSAGRIGGNSRMSRIRSAELTRHLREGATLILDALDELHEPLGELIEQLERALRSRIQVNLYAGWRTSPGFDVHWDGHDVLILQVHGRKHWKVYPMTREHPLPNDRKGEEPPKDPLWEGMLESGDVLYIPRGWWHVAVPVDEPTLHLTVGLHRATGLDFLSWYVDKLRTEAVVRQDVPVLRDETGCADYLERLRTVWEQAWHPGLLEEYRRYLDSQSRLLPHFGLPWTAQSSLLPTGSEWSLKWRVARPIEVEEGAATVTVRGGGKEWTFAADAKPILEMLQRSGACSYREVEAAAGRLAPEQVRQFVQELAREGLVSIGSHAD